MTPKLASVLVDAYAALAVSQDRLSCLCGLLRLVEEEFPEITASFSPETAALWEATVVPIETALPPREVIGGDAINRVFVRLINVLPFEFE